jgi:zinc transport system permease protein
MGAEWLDGAIEAFTRLFPDYTFFSLMANVKGLLAVVLVSLICGAISSLVVGNRMAFYSDALAHCAFAGIALGFLLTLFAGVRDQDTFEQSITLIMIVFGVLIGLAIAYVREKTGLASDTVIGVFFAGALGFGAMLFKAVSYRSRFSAENFLFGNLLTVTSGDVLRLVLLVLVTAAVLAWMYNGLVFTSFNPSLARSRNIPVRLCSYVFIVLLALIVNLCLQAVGVLLINALLIVPAATAANLGRNMRQLFWWTICLCLFAGVAGLVLSFQLRFSVRGWPEPITFGPSGTIVVLSVLLFFLSIALSPLFRGRQAA